MGACWRWCWSSLLALVILSNLVPQMNAWWLLSQMQISAVGGSSPALCDLIPGLGRRQRRLCQLHPDVMKAISDGIRRGVAECQRQFSNYRWNCTTVEGSGFGRIMLKLGSREAAFVYAISTASVVHSIAQSCSSGQIVDCSCDRRRVGRGRDTEGEFSWGGCSDNLPYAISFSRKFVDARDRRSRDGRALMNLHNNRAGRKAVKRNLRTQCKCHGVSGSCATRTCWKALPHFTAVGSDLNKRYQEALKVTVNPDGEGLIPADHRRFDFLYGPKAAMFQRKRVSRADLVYFEPSPDYCEADMRTGSLGTAGRQCNRTSNGQDSCDIMCCGRGYDTTRVQRYFKCNCKFIWCCRVECLTCTEIVDIHTCKAKAVVSNRTGSVYPSRNILRH
uniref:Protein Wnt n=1 Tax=Trichuris muris TaxID=70415 RepID=A0A5S6QW13_TRIMR